MYGGLWTHASAVCRRCGSLLDKVARSGSLRSSRRASGAELAAPFGARGCTRRIAASRPWCCAVSAGILGLLAREPPHRSRKWATYVHVHTQAPRRGEANHHPQNAACRRPRRPTALVCCRRHASSSSSGFPQLFTRKLPGKLQAPRLGPPVAEPRSWRCWQRFRPGGGPRALAARRSAA